MHESLNDDFLKELGMSTPQKSRLSPLQRTLLALVIAVLAGVGIYRVIGPEPPLPEPARTDIEAQARDLEQRAAEVKADGDNNTSKWMTEPLVKDGDPPAQIEPDTPPAAEPKVEPH